MKKRIFRTLACIYATICCISCEDVYIENTEGDVIDRGYMQFSLYNVDDTGFKTDEGETVLKTDFTSNTRKRIGAFVIEDGRITQSNIPISYESKDGIWTGKLEVTKDNAKIYVYYPYRTDFFDILGGEQLDTTAENPSTFFAGYIKNKEIASSYIDADICAGRGIVSNDTLSFVLEHQLSVIELKAKEGTVKVGYHLKSDPDYTWGNKEEAVSLASAKAANGKSLILQNGKYYYFFKPGEDAGDIEFSYNTNGIDGTETISTEGLEAGKALSVAVGTVGDQTAEHELRPGDFFMNDGSVISGNMNLTDNDRLKCVGIVFQTNPERIGEEDKAALGGNAHGTVMALKDGLTKEFLQGLGNYQGTESSRAPWDATTAKNWNGNSADVQSNTTDIEGIANVSNKLQDIKGNINGLHNCHIIEELNAPERYPAFAYAKELGQPAPNSPYPTTEWYIPSIGQWYDIILNLGEFGWFEEQLAQNANSTSVNYQDWKFNSVENDQVDAAIANMNIYLNEVGSPYAQPISPTTNSQYMSSSEGENDSKKGIRIRVVVIKPQKDQESDGTYKYRQIYFYQPGKWELCKVRYVFAF